MPVVSSWCEANGGSRDLHSKALPLLLKLGTVRCIRVARCISFLLQVAGPQPFLEDSLAAVGALSCGAHRLTELGTRFFPGINGRATIWPLNHKISWYLMSSKVKCLPCTQLFVLFTSKRVELYFRNQVNMYFKSNKDNMLKFPGVKPLRGTAVESLNTDLTLWERSTPKDKKQTRKGSTGTLCDRLLHKVYLTCYFLICPVKFSEFGSQSFLVLALVLWIARD